MTGAAAVYVAFASGWMPPPSSPSRLRPRLSAQATADSDIAAVTKNQQAIEAINDKIDRMFRRSVPK